MIHERVIERANHDAHWLGHEGVGEGAEFPIAEVSGGDEDASALLFGGLVMFETLIGNPIANVLFIDGRKAGEGDEHAADGAKDTIGEAAVFGDWKFGERHGQVTSGHFSELRQKPIEEARDSVTTAVGKTQRKDSKQGKESRRDGVFNACAHGELFDPTAAED